MIVLLAQNVLERIGEMSITLKAARINAEMTRPEVVEQLKRDYDIEISVNTLGNYENKVSQPDINTGKALASIYGRSVDDINFQ